MAEKRDPSQSYVTPHSNSDFAERAELQLIEIAAGVAEADRSDFVSIEALATVIAKYVEPIAKAAERPAG